MKIYDQIAAGQRIAQLRKQHGLTQSDLAEQINTSDKHIGRIERGECGPSPHIYARLANTFNVSLDYLFFGDSEEIFTNMVENILEKSSANKQELMIKILTLLDRYSE